MHGDEWDPDHDHDDHDDHDHDHNDDNPAEEGSRLHLEIHRAVDELGKYAIELEIKEEAGISKEKLIGFIDELMRSSTNNCMNNGADLVGHVKSFCNVGDGTIMSSIVDDRKPTKIQDHVDSTTIYDATIILHVIVHGIWDDKIRDLTLEVLPVVAKKWGINYVILRDYIDAEKSIAHHG